MSKILYIFVLSTLLVNSSCSQSKRFDFGIVENNIYINSFFELEITFNSDWIVYQDNNPYENLTIQKEVVKSKNNVKTKNLGRASLLDLRKDSTSLSPILLVNIINKRIDPKLKTIESYFDKIYEKNKYLFSNKSALRKKSIGSLEFIGISSKINSDIAEDKLETETFAAFKNGFILSFDLIYSNEKEKKELYEIIDKIKI